MVNVLSVIVMSILSFLVGMLWYSDALFGKPWKKLNKFKKNDLKPNPGAMVTGVATSFLQMTILGVILVLTNAQTFAEGASMGALIWLGFMATIQISPTLWEKKPLPLFWIHTLYSLVLMIVGGGILAIW